MITSNIPCSSKSALMALTFVVGFAGMAEALERHKMMRLHVQTEEQNSKDYGSLDSLMRKLKSIGKECSLTDYEYGGGIQCGPQGNWDVLIDFTFAPTRAPELIVINSIRANGVNGGEMNKREFAAFLDNYLILDVKPARETR